MTRDSRFDELNSQIAELDRPKYQRTMTPAAMDAQKRNGRKGIAGKIRKMTPEQRHRHGKRAQRFRVYRVTCECGKCQKCRHRVAKRKYHCKKRVTQKNACTEARNRVYVLTPGGIDRMNAMRALKAKTS